MADPGGGATEELEWQFLQCFGQPTENEEIQEGPSPIPLHKRTRCHSRQSLPGAAFAHQGLWRGADSLRSGTALPLPLCTLPICPATRQMTVLGPITEVAGLCAADLLSALEFDPSGEFLATGDRGGRVVLLQQVVHNKVSSPCVSVQCSASVLPFGTARHASLGDNAAFILCRAVRADIASELTDWKILLVI